MVDRSALYPGAVVTVRARVTDPGADGEGVTVEFRHGAAIWVPPTDILSVEPRPAVGDRVRNRHRARSVGGKIVHIHNGAAWVDYGNSSWLEPLAELIRIPDEPAPAEPAMRFKVGDRVDAGSLKAGEVTEVFAGRCRVHFPGFGYCVVAESKLSPAPAEERAP